MKQPNPSCPDCKGSGGVQTGDNEYSVCPCVTRQSGYYWVKHDSKWEVGEFTCYNTGDFGGPFGWFRTGFAEVFKDSDFDKIDEIRIEKSWSKDNIDAINHLNWIYNRMIYQLGQNPKMDYMIKFKSIIDHL